MFKEIWAEFRLELVKRNPYSMNDKVETRQPCLKRIQNSQIPNDDRKSQGLV